MNQIYVVLSDCLPCLQICTLFNTHSTKQVLILSTVILHVYNFYYHCIHVTSEKTVLKNISL